MRTSRKLFWGAVVGLAVMLSIGWFAGYRIVETASLPLGLWRIQAVPAGGVQVGQVAHYCPPVEGVFAEALRRGYIRDGICPGGIEPLYKPVVAVANDVVYQTPYGLIVNGITLENSVAFETDGNGDLMPVPLDDEISIVPVGRVWLVSSYSPYSFDSRYFGSVEAERITHVAEPVWVQGRWP